MRWLRWLAAAVAAVAVLVVAAVVYVATLDLNAYKDDVRSVLADATGRSVEITGPLHLAWTPRPSLTASGVRIANADWGSDPAMATIGDLAVGLEVMPLLAGDIEVHQFRLSDVRLLLERSAKGEGNWETGAPAGGGGGGRGGGVPTIQRLDLARATVVWKPTPDAPERLYRIDALTLEQEGPSGALRAVLTADLDGDALELDGTVPAPAALVRGDATVPVDIAGSLAGTPLAVVADLQLERGAGGAIRGMRADQLKAAFGGREVTGTFALDLAGERPRIDARLEAGTIELATLDEAAGGANGAAGDPMDRRLPVDLLTVVDAKVEMKVARLVVSGLSVDGLTATASLADGVLTLDPVAGKLADGTVSARAELDGREPPARLALAATASGMTMATVYQALMGEALIEGRGDAMLDLRGRGDTPRALLGSADGVSRLIVRDGMILNKYWELIAEDVATRFLPFVKEADRGRLNCLVSRFDIAKGVADATVLMVDSDQVTIGGAGKIDLAAQTLDMRLVPQPKDPSLLSLATPILLTGPLADPRAAPDPLAVAKSIGGMAAGVMIGPLGLLLPFVSGGSVEQPCPDAIAAAEGKRRPAGSKASGEQDKPGSVKGLFEGLRKAIE